MSASYAWPVDENRLQPEPVRHRDGVILRVAVEVDVAAGKTAWVLREEAAELGVVGAVPQEVRPGRPDFLVDLNNVRNHFGETGNVLGDTDGDGKVDLEYLNAVRNNFGAASPSPAPLTAAPRAAVVGLPTVEVTKPLASVADRRLDVLFTATSEAGSPASSLRPQLASRRLKAVDRVFAML